ncbi:putative wall-associated receptor kinase-like 16 isoform X2 [Malania oleifera]|uniref:putative wall-associated receptor kinase-like 16 isoform X2 n=1 Tax=Malania oleifera TaxID=397392 RepID=UPI0025AE57EC|nr:putative wall-associated receptor kinase-like 16 isoform X2 [Malania oleifera]
MLPNSLLVAAAAVLVSTFSFAVNAETEAQAQHGCRSRCGNVTIPYPFGTDDGPSGSSCHIDEHFLVTCNTTFDPPKAFLTDSNIQILNISLFPTEILILQGISYDCYHSNGSRNTKDKNWPTLNKFPISNTRNKFVAIGCDTHAYISGSRGRSYTTGCMSLCENPNYVINGSCSGIGCCQTSIPEGIRSYKIELDSFHKHSQQREWAPMVLDWAVGNQSCHDAEKNPASYACKQHSVCIDSENGVEYWCNCSSGFEGNPYLSNGCVDINECQSQRSPCNESATCLNSPGSFHCVCPKGYEGDGKIDGNGCSPIPKPNHSLRWIIMALGICISLLVMILGCTWLYWGLRRRELKRLGEKFFQQNGGIKLKEYLSKHERSAETLKIFTREELKMATNNYDQSRILGRGGQGIVYKGILMNKTIVAVKKSTTIDESQVDHFINEMIILSTINHRHVVKLLGCCLETRVPLLVYEFINNGTLYNHLHCADQTSVYISWETRMSIAIETAGAISYLHDAASIPIIHRDIKSANILLDKNNSAKVSDFGVSRLVPKDQAQLMTMVEGTLGYLDPEYLQSNELTTKSDVYSFGVVLVELLTGKKALSFHRSKQEVNLATFFTSSMKKDRLFEVVESGLMSEKNVKQIKEVAVLAMQCLRLRGEERPTMKEVARELEGLKILENHSWAKDDQNGEETHGVLRDSFSSDNGGCSTTNISGFDSIRGQVTLPFGNNH